jgi:hypothetical protein
MLSNKYFSFAEIVKGRNASVRVTEDMMFWTVDLAMVVTGKDRDDAGMAIRRMPEEVFPSVKMTERSMPGKGNGRTKLVSFKDGIELIMVLPGKIAKETRAQFAGIIQRYLAGDQSLIAEIQSNAASSAPIAKLARESVLPQVAAPAEIAANLEESKKRKALFELEVRERLCKVKDAEIASVTAFANAMNMLNPDWKKDARLRLRVEDSLKTTLLGSPPAAPLAITDGQAAPPPMQSVSVGEVAQKMGLGSRIKHSDSIAIGKAVAKAYLKKHGQHPPKSRRWVDGAEREVNAYTEADRKLIERAIRDRMLPHEEGDETSTNATSDSDE